MGINIDVLKTIKCKSFRRYDHMERTVKKKWNAPPYTERKEGAHGRERCLESK